ARIDQRIEITHCSIAVQPRASETVNRYRKARLNTRSVRKVANHLPSCVDTYGLVRVFVGGEGVIVSDRAKVGHYSPGVEESSEAADTHYLTTGINRLGLALAVAI